MNKKGFTLIELLTVLVLMSIIALIGTSTTFGIKKIINKSLWDNKVSLVENAAIKFGEDYKNLLPLKISVQDLIDKNYLKAKEYKLKENGEYELDSENNKIRVITNDTKEPSEEGYYINSYEINITIENDYVYAKLVQWDKTF